MKTSYQVSERRACPALDLARSTIRYESTANPQTALRMRFRDLAMSRLDFSRRGKPTDNAYIESFNGRFRQECLNEHWF